MTDADKLRRLAELSANISRRLVCVRTWSEKDKAQHRMDLDERDAILAAASPAYFRGMAQYRTEGGFIEKPSPWRLWVAGRLVRWALHGSV